MTSFCLGLPWVHQTAVQHIPSQVLPPRNRLTELRVALSMEQAPAWGWTAAAAHPSASRAGSRVAGAASYFIHQAEGLSPTVISAASGYAAPAISARLALLWEAAGQNSALLRPSGAESLVKRTLTPHHLKEFTTSPHE